MTYNQARLNILLAEDDLNLGEALAGFLREKGHRVDLAQNGREALEFLKKKTYPLVITDLVMPEVDGLAVLRAAKLKDKATLVVIMTGYASIDSAIEATREGAYNYLRKPFKLQEIDIAVANAARLLALHRENQTLLQKLTDLTAKLENFQGPAQPEHRVVQSTLPGKDRTSSPFFPVNFWLSPQADQHQADLLRLRHLYQESLITETEYQTLRQQLRI